MGSRSRSFKNPPDDFKGAASGSDLPDEEEPKDMSSDEEAVAAEMEDHVGSSPLLDGMAALLTKEITSHDHGLLNFGSNRNTPVTDNIVDIDADADADADVDDDDDDGNADGNADANADANVDAKDDGDNNDNVDGDVERLSCVGVVIMHRS